MSNRAGGWVTGQVGRYARSVNEVAIELRCDRHTVNDTVIVYGTALVDDDAIRWKRSGPPCSWRRRAAGTERSQLTWTSRNRRCGTGYAGPGSALRG
jgi:hypothetical protein